MGQDLNKDEEDNPPWSSVFPAGVQEVGFNIQSLSEAECLSDPASCIQFQVSTIFQSCSAVQATVFFARKVFLKVQALAKDDASLLALLCWLAAEPQFLQFPRVSSCSNSSSWPGGHLALKTKGAEDGGLKRHQGQSDSASILAPAGPSFPLFTPHHFQLPASLTSGWITRIQGNNRTPSQLLAARDVTLNPSITNKTIKDDFIGFTTRIIHFIMLIINLYTMAGSLSLIYTLMSPPYTNLT